MLEESEASYEPAPAAPVAGPYWKVTTLPYNLFKGSNQCLSNGASPVNLLIYGG